MSKPLPAGLSRFVSSILAHCLDIRAVWLIGHADAAPDAPRKCHAFIVFADARTLHMLRRSDHLHRADVQALVVFDGEQFENAWGPERISGSLARWAWREDGPDLAYYDESKWAQDGEAGNVVRTRMKAVLVWRSAAPI
jgi:hypothetical protein